MYKVVNGECAQTTIDRKFQNMTMVLAGLLPGSCAAEGFTEAEGSRELNVPLLGQVTLELYEKADLLGLAVQHVGAQVMGLEGSGPCCAVCKPPSTRHISVDAAHGRCSEACVRPGSFWLYKALKPNLAPADGESCVGSRFPAYNTTTTRGIPPMSMSLDVYVQQPSGVVALSKIAGGICGQAIVNEKSEAQVAKAAGLERGYCIARGFAEAAGSKAVEVPMVGKMQLALFRRAGELDLVDALRVSLTVLAAERVTLYKISQGVCGEATIDKKYAVPAEQFARLSEGNCKDHGYTVPSGSKDLHVPVLGDIQIALYKKAEQLQVMV